MWINKILYWKWVSNDVEPMPPETPTKKVIDYVTIGGKYRLAIGVYDDEKYTPVNREELSFFTKQY